MRSLGSCCVKCLMHDFGSTAGVWDLQGAGATPSMLHLPQCDADSPAEEGSLAPQLWACDLQIQAPDF